MILENVQVPDNYTIRKWETVGDTIILGFSRVGELPNGNWILIKITGNDSGKIESIIKTLLGLLDSEHVRYKLAAPTGRAAKRMMETSKRHTSTIHRLLEFDASIMQFAKNEQNAIEADFIIIDEASMIDIFLAHSILES